LLEQHLRPAQQGHLAAGVDVGGHRQHRGVVARDHLLDHEAVPVPRGGELLRQSHQLSAVRDLEDLALAGEGDPLYAEEREALATSGHPRSSSGTSGTAPPAKSSTTVRGVGTSISAHSVEKVALSATASSTSSSSSGRWNQALSRSRCAARSATRKSALASRIGRVPPGREALSAPTSSSARIMSSSVASMPSSTVRRIEESATGPATFRVTTVAEIRYLSWKARARA